MTINQDAPVITRADITIDAPVQRIWDIQTNVNAWPQWQPDVDSAHADGPLDVGRAFRWMTQGLDITSTVVEFDPPHRIEWGGPANGITAVHLWTFTAGADGVRVHTEESWEGEPIATAVDVMQQALDASLEEWLRRLKARAEAPA